MSTTRADAPGRPRVPRAQRREQLLDVALALLADEGFDVLSVDAIARRAGIDRVVVYRSFANLQVLLVALLRREQVRVDRQLDALIPRDPDGRSPRDILLEALAAFLAAVEAHPQTWRLALMPPESAPVALGKLIARRRAAIERRVRPLVRWGIGALEPTAGPLDEEVLSRMLLSLAEEHGRLLLQGDGTFPAHRLLRSATLVLDAVRWR